MPANLLKRPYYQGLPSTACFIHGSVVYSSKFGAECYASSDAAFNSAIAGFTDIVDLEEGVITGIVYENEKTLVKFQSSLTKRRFELLIGSSKVNITKLLIFKPENISNWFVQDCPHPILNVSVCVDMHSLVIL